MVTQIKITNHRSSTVIFRGAGFYIVIPADAVELEAQIPSENAPANIANIQDEHPFIEIATVGVAEGIPTNDLLYISPSYFEDENYQGVWDASSGADPDMDPKAGWYWRVSVGGSHPLDGIASWEAGDHVKWTGTHWVKIVTWVQSHENLTTFQGGDIGEHYHLTALQYASLLPGGDPVFRDATVDSLDAIDIEVDNITLDGGVLGEA